MVWQVGDRGFTLHLAPDIPQRLGEVAPRALATLLGERSWPQLWAIHPGGRAIVDRLAELFNLAPAQVASSLSVLRRYGNMSSPTILFVLDELRQRLRQERPDEPTAGVAMAFGPGLVVEMARIAYVPCAVREALPNITATPVAYVA
jgi:predicted naringenin-chalcone synthase